MIILKLDLGAMERLFDTPEAKIELQRCVTAEFIKRHFQKVSNEVVRELLAKQTENLKDMIETAADSIVGASNNHWSNPKVVLSAKAQAAIAEAVNAEFKKVLHPVIVAATDAYKSDIVATVKNRLDYDIKLEVDRQFKAKMEALMKSV